MSAKYNIGDIVKIVHISIDETRNFYYGHEMVSLYKYAIIQDISCVTTRDRKLIYSYKIDYIPKHSHGKLAWWPEEDLEVLIPMASLDAIKLVDPNPDKVPIEYDVMKDHYKKFFGFKK